jgi:preprotein translocase subunit SecG
MQSLNGRWLAIGAVVAVAIVGVVLLVVYGGGGSSSGY